MERHIKSFIINDLEKKLVFLVGPRQSGKTWLAKELAKGFSNPLYLNYDQIKDRKIIENQNWLPSIDLLILDELHKMSGWKNFIKGIFDTKPESMRLLVTGSARLDAYDRLGDSLAGRYFRHRLLPFSLSELKWANESPNMEQLIERGGFPEPFLATDLVTAQRWRMQYVNSLLSTDIFDIEPIQNMKAMRLVFDLLRSRVGSPISYQSIAEDVAISPTTVKKYIQILEALYIVFMVTPHSKNIARSLLKEPKIYFFDTGLVDGDEGATFENFVAVSLLKHVYEKADLKAEEYHLRYIRTKDGHEIDFALILKDEIKLLIEAKVSDTNISKTLTKFYETYNVPAIQLLKNLRTEFQKNGLRVLRAHDFLMNMSS